MDEFLVWHISETFLGDEVLLEPRSPRYPMSGENEAIPRICVCMSIYGCILAISPNILHLVDKTDFYLYYSYIDPSKIYQPCDDEVPDSWVTGELWITEPHTFYLKDKYIINKHADILGTPYSRYEYRASCIEDSIMDRIYAEPVYGCATKFSTISLDFTKDRDPDLYKDSILFEV